MIFPAIFSNLCPSRPSGTSGPLGVSGAPGTRHSVLGAASFMESGVGELGNINVVKTVDKLTKVWLT